MFNSGWEDQGFLVHFTHAVSTGLLSAAWQSDYGATSSARATIRGRSFLLPLGKLASLHRELRACPTSAGSARSHSPASSDRRAAHRSGSVPDRDDRTKHRTRGRLGERLPCQGQRRSSDGSRALELGVDVNGRYGLEALDIIQAYDLAGTMTRDTTNVSIDTRAASTRDCSSRPRRRLGAAHASRAVSAAITSRPRTSAASSAIARRPTAPRRASAP